MTSNQLPFRQPSPLDVAPELRALQSQGVIHPVRTPAGHNAWLVTDYEWVRRLLDDDRLGRSHPQPDAAARTGESALFGGPLGDFDTEAADHARLRCCSRTSRQGICGRWCRRSKHSPDRCSTNWSATDRPPICTRN